MALRRIGKQTDAARSEYDLGGPGPIDPEVQQQLQQRAQLEFQRRQALDAIGRKSDLYVESVVALCDRVIDVARKDLQGRYTD